MSAGVAITAMSCVSAIGDGTAQTVAALKDGRGGLAVRAIDGGERTMAVGEVAGLDERPLDRPFREWDCRNNRLAERALSADRFADRVAEVAGRFGPERVAIILGTSTSGILETEAAYRHRDPETGALPDTFRYRQTHDTFSVVAFARARLGLAGPALALSTACSSSAKAFASGARMLAAGIVDAVVVGGVDTLCQTTLRGFASLDLVAPGACRPCAADRDGISIGEAGAFALLERLDRVGDRRLGRLTGYGESSDGYHMSSPHPDGVGADLAMRRALGMATRRPGEIGYVNMHGTASELNDGVEDAAIFALFGNGAPCSSTKGWTGHTLGAAGALEAVISLLCIRESVIPGTLNTTAVDPAFRSGVRTETTAEAVSAVLSNSFGFGGSNAALVLEA